jgi:hypothetical protein
MDVLVDASKEAGLEVNTEKNKVSETAVWQSLNIWER